MNANPGKHKVWDDKKKTVTTREPWDSPRMHITLELSKKALAKEGKTTPASAKPLNMMGIVDTGANIYIMSREMFN